MPRIPKRLLALGGLAAAGGAARSARRKRRASRAATPAPSATGPTAAPIAPPPVETPGPSVTAPQDPASTTEQQERADAAAPDAEVLSQRAGGPVDELVERETAAAAAEAAGIGGPRPDDDTGDPAMRPVYEAGGGEAEGFEQAEADLVENASHGGGGGNPIRDAFTPEVESDEATAVDAEGDEEKVSEVVEDVPDAERSGAADAEQADAPGSGPGITHER